MIEMGNQHHPKQSQTAFHLGETGSSCQSSSQKDDAKCFDIIHSSRVAEWRLATGIEHLIHN